LDLWASWDSHRDRQAGIPSSQDQAMIEIQLPCCEARVRVEALGDEVRCDACSIELTVAEDVPEPVRIAA
jgi:hypothetical protein